MQNISRIPQCGGFILYGLYEMYGTFTVYVPTSK